MAVKLRKLAEKDTKKAFQFKIHEFYKSERRNSYQNE